MPGFDGHSRISALREDREPWRIDRLNRVLLIANEAAGTDARRRKLEKAIVGIRDEKGELYVTWDAHYFEISLVELMRDAWRSLDEFQPLRNSFRLSPGGAIIANLTLVLPSRSPGGRR